MSLLPTIFFIVISCDSYTGVVWFLSTKVLRPIFVEPPPLPLNSVSSVLLETQVVPDSI